MDRMRRHVVRFRFRSHTPRPFSQFHAHRLLIDAGRRKSSSQTDTPDGLMTHTEGGRLPKARINDVGDTCNICAVCAVWDMCAMCVICDMYTICGLGLTREDLDVHRHAAFLAEDRTLRHIEHRAMGSQPIQAERQIFARLIVHLKFEHVDPLID